VTKALILLVTGAVALFVTGAPGIASAQTPTAVGTVTAVSGNVTVTRLAAAPQRLKIRDALYWRDVVTWLKRAKTGSRASCSEGRRR